LDIAKELGVVNERYTIDFTSQLPVEAGFKSIKFDDIEDYFGVDGSNHRGYELNTLRSKLNISLKEPAELKSFDGTVIYRCNSGAIFNPFVAKAHQFNSEEPKLVGSAQFALASKIKDGDEVRFTQDGIELLGRGLFYPLGLPGVLEEGTNLLIKIPKPYWIYRELKLVFAEYPSLPGFKPLENEKGGKVKLIEVKRGGDKISHRPGVGV